MKINTFINITAWVGFITGFVLLVFPTTLLGMNGIQADAAGITLARLLGAEFIGFNLVTWMSKNPGNESTRRMVVFSHSVSETLGFIVLLYARLNGLGNNMLWSFVAVYFIFALGYLYFQYIAKDQL